MNRFMDCRFGSRMLVLALSASLPAVGCQTLTSRTSTTTTASAAGSGEPAGPKTEFHREVGPEQEYNVHMEVARFHESQGSFEASVAEYKMAADVCEKKGSALAGARLGPVQHALAQRRMAASLDRLGRFAQAEPHYLTALKYAPNDPRVWNDAGYSYYLQNRLVEAERTLKTANSLDPNNSRVLTNLGLTLAAQGKNDEALAALTRAGGPAVGHANLGYIVAAMGKTDLAREHYQKALTLQPELTAARQALAKLDASPTARPTTAVASTTVPAVKPLTTLPMPKPYKPPTSTVASSSPVVARDPRVSRVATTKTTIPASEAPITAVVTPGPKP